MVREVQRKRTFVHRTYALDRHLRPGAFAAKPHEGFIDRNPRHPSGKGRVPLKLPQPDESFLKALLHNVFRVRLVASESQDNAQNSSVITTDQHFKRLISPAFGGSNQRHVIFS
jgi:hypothetical protein